MPASPLTKAASRPAKTVKEERRPLAANVKCWKGGRVAYKNGFVVVSSGASDEVATNAIFKESVDNTGGADGAKLANIEHAHERLIRLYDNDSGAPCVVAGRETPCSILDDHTVTLFTGVPGGIIYDVTSEGVWVEELASSGAQPASRVQSGTTTLVAGTKTVTGVVLGTNSRIILTMKDPGAGALTTFIALDAPAGSRTTSQFVINAIDNAKAVLATAVCTVDWLIVG